MHANRNNSNKNHTEDTPYINPDPFFHLRHGGAPMPSTASNNSVHQEVSTNDQNPLNPSQAQIVQEALQAIDRMQPASTAYFEVEHPTMRYPLGHTNYVNHTQAQDDDAIQALLDNPQRTKPQNLTLLLYLRGQGYSLQQCAHVLSTPLSTVAYWERQHKHITHTLRQEKLTDNHAIPIEEVLEFNRALWLHLQALAQDGNYTTLKPNQLVKLMMTLIKAQQQWLKR
jgi:DNA-binding transcriptional regulator YiaG